jgi:hypothetical protein
VEGDAGVAVAWLSAAGAARRTDWTSNQVKTKYYCFGSALKFNYDSI